KVVLMMNERGREHFVGQVEKAEVVEPGNDARVLDQIRNLVDQIRVCLEMHAPAESPGVRLELAGDPIAPPPVRSAAGVLRQPRPRRVAWRATRARGRSDRAAPRGK